MFVVEFGAGGVLGANFNIGRRFTIGVTSGFMFAGYAGVIDIFDDEEVTGRGGYGFVNVSVMGRAGGDAY